MVALVAIAYLIALLASVITGEVWCLAVTAVALFVVLVFIRIAMERGSVEDTDEHVSEQFGAGFTGHDV